MNNEQFRRLVGSNSSASQNGASSTTSSKPRSLLGARPKSSAPSQGRSYGANFFKQKAQSSNGTSHDAKKQRTNVPKGTKLAAGYVDRTQGEREDEEKDEIAQRLKALEEKVKEGEMEMEEFERIRDEITGGDISKTHLVKGLDRRLLERVRRGEDVLSGKSEDAAAEDAEPIDEDDAFDELEQHEVMAEVREERVKQGEKAKYVPPVAGQKRSRDQILADMKAAREAAKAAARPQLGSGFKKIRKDEGPRIEVDAKGREVLITVDEDGNVKRRVKKAKPVEEPQLPQAQQDQEVVSRPSKNKDMPLGADVIVPAYEPTPAEESDEDIFAGAGHDFNPLADLEDDDASDTEAAPTKRPEVPAPSRKDDDLSGSEEGETRAQDAATEVAPGPRKSYFNDDATSSSILGSIKNEFKDPSVLAALAKSQRAQEVSENASKNENESADDAVKRKRREAMLNTRDRDAEDMDMGFGGSRFDDADEMAQDGEKVKFSKWTGGADDGSEDEGGKGEGNKRKRGPKKRKGDKNSAADVLGAMEKQRKG